MVAAGQAITVPLTEIYSPGRTITMSPPPT
jgi:hypothetical protein